MSDVPLHSVSVAGVALDVDGRVLLIRRRDNDQWQIPGGVLELSETFTHGVVREVREETGVDVEVQRLTGVYKNLTLGVVALVYRCAPVSGHAISTDEASTAEWVAVPDALRRTGAVFAVRVSDAIEDQPEICRVHDGTQLID